MSTTNERAAMTQDAASLAPARTGVLALTEREDGWFARRLLGGAVAGIAGAMGMYLVLAVAAVAGGRGASYPFHAVQALMSGGRVLPEDPGNGLGEPQVQDVIVGPVLFALPAVLVGVLTAWWTARRAGSTTSSALSPAAPAVVLTGACFLVFIVLLGFQPSDPSVQRISSGYGVRQLGMAAWALGHLAYIGFLLATFGPVVRGLESWRARRSVHRALAGDGRPV